MQVEGEAKVQQLTRDLAAQQKVMRDLIEQYKAGSISLSQYTADMQQAAKAAAPLANQLKETQKGLASLGAPGILQASYAIQDFTSVLSGGQGPGAGPLTSSVQNNIPGLLMMLGKGAGVAGAVSVASVAVGLLYRELGQAHQVVLWQGGRERDRAAEEAQGVDGRQLQGGRGDPQAEEGGSTRNCGSKCGQARGRPQGNDQTEGRVQTSRDRLRRHKWGA